MSNIIDFKKFKDQKDKGNKLEDNYIKFLNHINSFIGVPKSLEECTEALYYTVRYLQGTVNCLSVLTMLTPMKTKEMDELKHMLINWLEEIIECVKNL